MKKGFTLIELLVTATIMSIIAGGSTASYIRFNQKEKLKNGALMVKTYLRKAQTKAMAGEKSCLTTDNEGCGGSTEGCGNDTDNSEKLLDGWCLDLYHSPGGLRRGGYLYGHCGGPVNDPPQHADFNVENYELPEDVSISFNPSYGGILLFRPLGQGVNLGPVPGDNLTICLSSSNFGVTSRYKLSVTTSGEINDDGFVQSCP